MVAAVQGFMWAGPIYFRWWEKLRPHIFFVSQNVKNQPKQKKMTTLPPKEIDDSEEEDSSEEEESSEEEVRTMVVKVLY